MDWSKVLVIIPARGGSKGIPYKNIKHLCGKPLIAYTVECALQLVPARQICVSTDDVQIAQVLEQLGVSVPFIRPAHLATDTASTEEVLLHALDFYHQQGIVYDIILLLQPTSPLRKPQHITEAFALFTAGVDMVVSVCSSKSAAVLCTENSDGLLETVFNAANHPRQYFENFYEYNGAIYIIQTASLQTKGIAACNKIKYIMPRENSVDIDTEYDWKIAEMMINTSQI